MAKAGKKSSTRKPPKTSVSNTSQPIGKRYEQSIHIQQAQRVSLMMWVPMWVRATIARVVARLRPGRPREYDVDGAITGVAKDCATKGVEDYLDRFVAR